MSDHRYRKGTTKAEGMGRFSQDAGYGGNEGLGNISYGVVEKRVTGGNPGGIAERTSGKKASHRTQMKKMSGKKNRQGENDIPTEKKKNHLKQHPLAPPVEETKGEGNVQGRVNGGNAQRLNKT